VDYESVLDWQLISGKIVGLILAEFYEIGSQLIMNNMTVLLECLSIPSSFSDTFIIIIMVQTNSQILGLIFIALQLNNKSRK